MFTLHCVLFIISIVVKVLAVPPAACRAEFRWDDCGKPPKPVMYYWKLGSRCEIGYWRGCLPNPNMFADEYECINTCVFVDRPPARSYTVETELPETSTENSTNPDNPHNIDNPDNPDNSNETTPDNNTSNPEENTHENVTNEDSEPSETNHTNSTGVSNSTDAHNASEPKE